MTGTHEIREWAREEFGDAELGDRRRTRRLVNIAVAAALKPAGCLSQVCRDEANLQGAYDFVESDHVRCEAITNAMTTATARRCAEHSCVLVAVDGSSVTLTDKRSQKDFGSIGDHVHGARGLKVINALAIDPQGVPLGVLAQRWWARAVKKHRRKSKVRAVADKETQRWLDAIDDVCERLEEHAADTRAWFQIDREGDSGAMLLHLASTGHYYTVRSTWDRRLDAPKGKKRYLRPTLRMQPVLGYYAIDIPAGLNRTARKAIMAVRAKRVTLRLQDPWKGGHRNVTVYAVWARESHTTTPKDEKSLDWLLFTNVPVTDSETAHGVIGSYKWRWRVEDFHKALKSGCCSVEDTQLRSSDHVIKWATILSAVAARAERIKHLSRQQPDLPASVELTETEIRALIAITRKYKKKNETIPDGVPSLEKAVLWVARLGGYRHHSKGGPPGVTTIARGLELLGNYVEILEVLHL